MDNKVIWVTYACVIQIGQLGVTVSEQKDLEAEVLNSAEFMRPQRFEHGHKAKRDDYLAQPRTRQMSAGMVASFRLTLC